MRKTEPKRVKKESLAAETWRMLRKNTRAMISLGFIIVLLLAAIFADYLTPYSYDQQDLQNANAGFSAAHILGTDNVGRDLFTRVIYGARYSLAIGVVSVTLAMIGGGFLGAIAGYYGGAFDALIMRFTDIWQTIPATLMAIVLAATMGAGVETAMIALGITNMPAFARLLRGCVLTVRKNEYIEAAQTVRAGDIYIILHHIIPNVLSPIIVQSTLTIGTCILNAAALSFVGLGAQLPLPEWGAMLSVGREFIRTCPRLVIVPGVAIMLTVLSLNLLGDGLRDALDPKLRQ